jgi:hypothetical protein
MTQKLPMLHDLIRLLMWGHVSWVSRYLMLEMKVIRAQVVVSFRLRRYQRIQRRLVAAREALAATQNSRR